MHGAELVGGRKGVGHESPASELPGFGRPRRKHNTEGVKKQSRGFSLTVNRLHQSARTKTNNGCSRPFTTMLFRQKFRIHARVIFRNLRSKPGKERPTAVKPNSAVFTFVNGAIYDLCESAPGLPDDRTTADMIGWHGLKRYPDIRRC